MLLNEKEQKRNRIITFVAVAIFFIVTWAIFVHLGGFFYCRDLRGHRAIVGYALRGYDPYLLIGKKPINDFVGEIYENFSTVPWALVFGAFFYPGYMPLTAAKIYLVALHFVFLALMLYLIRKKYGERSNLLLIALCALSHFSFMYSIHYGNCGGVVSLMLICALILVDDKPVAAGVLMGFALLKPQISALFCLVWLIDKKIKPLVVAGAFTAAGWAAASAFTKTNPVQLLKEMLAASTSSEEQYLGLVSPLRFLGVSSVAILAVNIVIGIAFTFILGMWLKKKGNDKNSVFLKYIPAAVASCFWIYKNGTDFLVLLIVVIAIIEILEYCQSLKDFFAALVLLACFEMSRAAVSTVSSFVYDNFMIRDLIKSAEGFLLIILGIAACVMITKINQRIEKTE